MADAPTVDPEADKLAEQRRQGECARKWIAEIGASERAQQKWLIRARKIVRRYKVEWGDSDKIRRFALLWSNTQTIHPAIYARPPQPAVSRRFKDADPVGRSASEVLERALTFSADTQDLDGVLKTGTLDYVLIGRGTTWERYVPTTGPMVTPQIPLQLTTGPQGDRSDDTYTDDTGAAYGGDDVKFDDQQQPYAEGEPYEPVIFEQSITDYVNWEDFGTSVARTWDEVTYVWRRVYLSRDQLIDRFGDNLGKMIPLDWGPIQQGKADDSARMLQKAAVYEIWDKASKTVYWISKSWSSRPLDERPDPLGLENFFPCPRPLLSTTATDSLIPVPDYAYYQDQAEEIDQLTARIAILEKALKVRGFYAGDIKTNLNNLLNADTNVMIPVPEWQSLKDGGGISGKIEWFPIANVIQTLEACINARKQLLDDVYQLTGIADILRGMNDPRATATAEGIKSTWGTLRIRERQKEVQRFARDVIQIKGEVIAGKFSADTLKLMTGVKLPTNAEKAQAEAQVQQMMLQAQLQARQAQMMGQGAPVQPGQPQAAPAPAQPPPIPDELAQVLRSPTWEDVETLLRNNALRQFRIDIETDSTIEPNESQDKAATVELLQALGQMVQQWGPALEAQPMLAPMVGELIKFALRRFRASRQLEDVIDSTVDKLVAQAASAPPPSAQPAQKPVDQTAIAVASINQQTEQMVQQAETARAQMEAGLHQQEIGLKQGDQQLKLVSFNRDPNPQVNV